MQISTTLLSAVVIFFISMDQPLAEENISSKSAGNDQAGASKDGKVTNMSHDYQKNTPGTAKLRTITRDKRRALLHAASFGDVASLNKLLKQGASPNARAKDKTGRTALILAAAGGHIDSVKALLANGATVDDKDRTGHTALNWAAMRGHTQVVTALLNKGADINTRDNNGVSPLLYAVGTHNITMVRLPCSQRCRA